MLRAIVAYEAYHNDTVTSDYVVHHDNQNRLDDSKDNLIKELFGIHSSRHTKRNNWVEMECCICGSPKRIPIWRITQRKSTYERFFCSSACYRKRVTNTESHKKSISEGLKIAYKENKR